MKKFIKDYKEDAQGKTGVMYSKLVEVVAEYEADEQRWIEERVAHRERGDRMASMKAQFDKKVAELQDAHDKLLAEVIELRQLRDRVNGLLK